MIGNRIYQQISGMVAGMHEYTAMEALYTLVNGGKYDLVVLDTPPSRHALDFLEAPRRLSRLVDSRAPLALPAPLRQPGRPRRVEGAPARSSAPSSARSSRPSSSASW